MSEIQPIRVTHIISCPASGGAEVYVKDLSIAAVHAGHSASIVFLDRAEEVGRDEAYQRNFLKQLDSEGVKYEFIGAKARRNPLFGWLRTRQVLGQFESEVVHAHLFYGIFFAIGCGLPVIYTRHGIGLRLPKMAYRIIINRIVSSYVGISVACAAMLRDGGCRPVVQINNGVSASRLRVTDAGTGGASKAATQLAAPFTFLAVGRLIKLKNYPRLLAALAEVPVDKPWRLQIAGEGRDRERGEEAEAVGAGAGEVLDGVLRVRHEAEDAAGIVLETGDLGAGAVDVLAIKQGGVAVLDVFFGIAGFTDEAAFRMGESELGIHRAYLHATEWDPDRPADPFARRMVPLTPRYSAGLVASMEREETYRLGLEFYYTGRQSLDDNPYRERSRPYVIVGMLGERWITTRAGVARVFLNLENIGNVRQTREDPLLLPARGKGGRWTTDAWTDLGGFTVNGGVRLTLP